MITSLPIKILEVGRSTKSGKFYPKDEIEKAILNFNSKYSLENPSIGLFRESEPYRFPDMTRATHVTHSLFLKDDCVYANITLLNTEWGLFLQKVLTKIIGFPIMFAITSEYDHVTDLEFRRIDIDLESTEATE